MSFDKNITLAVDHLIVAAPDLDSGSQWVADILGVMPLTGGQHPHWGTHNALLGLGEHTYLEVLAPDPTLPIPARGRWLHDFCQRGPGLATWAIHTTDIDTDAQQVLDLGISLGSVQTGSRQRADGRVLSWQLTDPYALPFSGVFPFLIDWSATPHPGTSLPRVGMLTELRLEHPEADLLNRHFQNLGIAADAFKAKEPRLSAILTVNGQKIKLPGLPDK